MDMNHFKLQFITHFTDTYSYLDSARMALEGGCRWVQLRMKHASDEETEAVALEVQKLCRTYGATFLIDDRVELVRKLKADGVHLGKNDMPIAEARKILGKDFLIGGTANTFDDVRAHYEAGADYIGCGPFRFTTTKEKAQPYPRTGRLPFHRTADEGGRHPPAHRSHRRHHPGRHPCHYADRRDGHRPERHHPADSESGGRNEENRESIKNEE